MRTHILIIYIILNRHKVKAPNPKYGIVIYHRAKFYLLNIDDTKLLANANFKAMVPDKGRRYY